MQCFLVFVRTGLPQTAWPVLVRSRYPSHCFTFFLLFFLLSTPRTALTYPQRPSAWALTHSLIGELLALCRNNWSVYTCTDLVALGAGSRDVVLWCAVVLLWCCCGCYVILKRVMVTPPVCPRLVENLTTLTFGALRRSHVVSTAFETVAKKAGKARCPRAHQQFIMNCQEHNRSWMGSA